MDLPDHIVARREYLDAHDDTAHDDPQRRVPRMMSFVKLVTRWTSRDWKQVPTEYWALDMNDEGYSVAVVSCLCGETPRAEVLAPAVRCDCGRFFYFGGDRVLAVQPPESA